MNALVHSSPRLPWIDIAKGVAMILVFYGHAPEMGIARNVIFSFHMPLFFILAGYTFSLRKNFLNILYSSAKRLLIPYFLIWAASCLICYLAFDDPFNVHDRKQLLWGFAGPYEHPVFKTSIPAIGVAWFFWTLFWARLIFWLILKLSSSKRVCRYILTAITFSIGYSLGKICQLPMNVDIACACSPFMLIGFEMKQAQLVYRYTELTALHRIAIAGVLLILWLPFAIWYPVELAIRIYGPCGLFYIGAITGSLLLFMLCAEISKIFGLRQFLTFVGINSLFLLCFHHLEGLIVPHSLVQLSDELTQTPLLPLTIGTKGVLCGLFSLLCWKAGESLLSRLKSKLNAQFS